MSFPAESMAGRAVDRGGVPLENAMRTRTSAWLASALVAGSLGLLSAGVADAAAFRVGFDPQFSTTGSFANLGFKGSGILTLDSGCLAVTGETIVGTGTCLNAEFTSLTLELYNFADGPGTILETLTYAPPSQPISGGIVSQIVTIAPGDLVGLDTGFFGPLFATAITGGTSPAPLPSGADISLRFVSNFQSYPSFSVAPDVVLQICNTDNDEPICATSTPGLATVTFSAVPEPATGLLALTALGALGWVRRRRSRG